MRDNDFWNLEDDVRALRQRVFSLENRLQVIYRALVSHVGDKHAHPNSANNAEALLRAIADTPQKDSK